MSELKYPQWTDPNGYSWEYDPDEDSWGCAALDLVVVRCSHDWDMWEVSSMSNHNNPIDAMVAATRSMSKKNKDKSIDEQNIDFIISMAQGAQP